MQRVDTDRDHERASRAQPAWSRRDRRVERAQMPWLGRKPEGRWSLHPAYLEAKRSQLGVEHDRLQAAQESLLLWPSRKELSGAKQAVSGIRAPSQTPRELANTTLSSEEKHGSGWEVSK